MSDDHEAKLVHYLTDVYSIERQAISQLRGSPEIAGVPALARAFRDHLAQTEAQAERVRERLEAHGESPARVKDAAMYAGGKGSLLFARTQPDTPGKLLAHSHSFEAFERAAYEMLIRMAERAGDAETARIAREIRDQEHAMRERLAASFDAAADASIAVQDAPPADLLAPYLTDAHALEVQSARLLEKSAELAGGPELDRIYREHLDETRRQQERLEERLAALGADPSKVKDTALDLEAWGWSLFFRAQSDTPGKLAVFAYAVENLEIAGYELLRRVAERASDHDTARLAQETLAEERAMADRLLTAFDQAFEASLATEKPSWRTIR